MKVKRHEIVEALRKLEDKGYVIEPNYSCCSNCSVHELSQEYGEDLEKFVYWHEQNEEAFDYDYNKELINTLHLGWGGDGREIVNVLRKAGIQTDWEGHPDYKIRVLPEKIKRGEFNEDKK